MNSTLCRSWSIALAVVAVATSAVADDLRPTRIETNEAAAIASLREIAAAQTKFQASGVCDVDGDGVGEFGLLRELTGAVGVRTNSTGSTLGSLLNPPLLPVAFRAFNANSEVSRAGYLFKMFLPGAAGMAVEEVCQLGVPGTMVALDPDLAETTWCCYACPARYEITGRRSFFMNQTGDITAIDAENYRGTGSFTWANAGAAFVSGGAVTSITGSIAVGTIGRDNNFWRAIDSRSSDIEQSVRGRIAPVQSAAHVIGTFEIASRRLTSSTSETIVVRAAHVSRASITTVVLTNVAGGTAEFESRRWFWPSRGNVLSFDSALQAYPDGVTSLTAFGGGTIELRVDGVAVARGTIPEFVTPSGPNAPNAFARWRGRSELSPTFPGESGRGTVTAELTNEPGGTRQRLFVEVADLYDALQPWDFRAGLSYGYGRALSLRMAANPIPGRAEVSVASRRLTKLLEYGGLSDLSGKPVTVTSDLGTVLVGTFPVVE